MEDLMDESNKYNFSLNRSFDKLDEKFYPEEKTTAFKTGNPTEVEFKSTFLNDFHNNFENSYNENEDSEDDYTNLFLNKKTKREEEIKHENKSSNKDNTNNSIINIETKLNKNKELNKKEELNNINNKNLIYNINLKKKEAKKGRKNKNSDEESKHDKYGEDNIVYKIKSSIFNDYIIDTIKENSINKDIDLKKLQTKEFTHDVTKQNNEILFPMKIKDILSEHPISTKYSTFDRFENKKIIEKIYRENKEINVIKILELTFEELLILYRRSLKDPEDMKKFEGIKAKIEGLDLENENKYKDFGYLIKQLEKNHEKKYIEKVKKTCIGYENFFFDKKERKLN